MNQIKKNAVFILVILLFVSCKNSNEQKTEITTDEHTSQNSLDWPGTYKGTLPCADCEGIEKIIQINEDNTYSLKSTYLGKGKKGEFDETGTFTWNKEGNTITTIPKDKSISQSYFVGEKKLIQLNNENKIITGPLADFYILKQIKSR